MKNENAIKKTLRAIATCALALTCFYQPAIATETPKDVSKEIRDLRSTVVSAEVYIVAPGTASRISFKEEDILGVASCMYQVSEKKDVESLIDVVANAGIVEEISPTRGYDARIGIFLHTADHDTVRLVTGPDYTTEPARGIYNRAVRVVARMGFEADLRHWAAQRKPTRTTLICQGD